MTEIVRRGTGSALWINSNCIGTRRIGRGGAPDGAEGQTGAVFALTVFNTCQYDGG